MVSDFSPLGSRESKLSKVLAADSRLTNPDTSTTSHQALSDPPQKNHPPPQCRASVKGPVCVEYGTSGADTQGGLHCSKLLCNWQTEYCDNPDVQKDENGEWACMGSCQPRTNVTDAYDACTCAPPTGSTVIPDFQGQDFCFYGTAAVPGMWQPPAGSGSGSTWKSVAAFRAMYSPVSLYLNANQTDYTTALTSFMVSNCPLMRPVSILTPDPKRNNALFARSYYLNSCGCRKGDKSWISYPGPVGAGP